MPKFVLISFHFILVDLNDAMKKQANLLVLNKEAHKLISNFNVKLQETKEKELCKTSSIIKSRGCTTWVSCLELEQAFSLTTGGVLITPGICITFRFLFCGGPCETSTSFLLR